MIFFSYLIEYIYRVGFYLVSCYKKWRGNKVFPFKIIAVGNLTTGGTGKSVFVPFLVDVIGKNRTAIVLRGYRGSISRSGKSALVTDGTTIFLTTEASGDEAMMYAQQEQVPVAVGKNRALSCNIIENLGYKNITHIVLDDAYQNHDVRKNFEVLLIDARKPFDNGHLLPFGHLREKDYTRADVIVLTHADQVTELQRGYIKRTMFKAFPPKHIFCGAHIVAGIYRCNVKKVDSNSIAKKRILLVAAVGSFQGVYDTVASTGVMISATKEFADHYSYTHNDVNNILTMMKNNNLDGVITTAKDWVKLAPLVSHSNRENFYVIRIRFEFLSSHEYDDFIDIMKKRMLV